MTDGTLTCEWDVIAAGASEVVNISGTTDPADCGIIGNTATVDASNLPVDRDVRLVDELGDPLTSTDSIAVLCPELNIEKVATAGNDTIHAGDVISYTITVSNGSAAGIARDVVLIDTIPDAETWTLVPSIGTCGEPVNGDVECELGDIGPGESVTIVVTRTSTAEDCGQIVNTATVDAANLPRFEEVIVPAATNQLTDSATITVLCPDLTIEKTAVDSEGAPTDENIAPGDPVSFKIEVVNNGEGNATEVVITDVLPADIVWSIVSVVGSDESVDTESCEIVDGTLTCDIGTLNAGSSIAVTIGGLSPEDSCWPIYNSATVSSVNWSGVVRLAGETSDDAIIGMLCPVEVLKFGPDGESPLAGACFTLSNDLYEFGPVCTEDLGETRFTMIPEGTYILREVVTPEGHQPLEPIEVNVTYGAILRLLVKNDIKPLVVKFNCLVDPGELNLVRIAIDPSYAPDGCERVEGVNFTATVNGTPLGETFTTDENGRVRIPARTGDTVVITEDISSATEGYLPRENPITIDPVPVTGGVAAFVNLVQDGELQLIKIYCKSDKPYAPVFEVVGPDQFGLTERKDQECWRGSFVTFTVSGGDLENPIEVTTNRDGVFGLELLAGTYTITEVSTGASATVEVVPNATTYVKVTNYTTKKPEPGPTPTPSPNEPVENLPDTGAGTSSGSLAAWMVMLPLAALIFLAGGLALTKNEQRKRRS
ncbi:MAG: SpaA isopeptide-forming pilin-related protein [Thermomicrobiales bacterium]